MAASQEASSSATAYCSDVIGVEGPCDADDVIAVPRVLRGWYGREVELRLHLLSLASFDDGSPRSAERRLADDLLPFLSRRLRRRPPAYEQVRVPLDNILASSAAGVATTAAVETPWFPKPFADQVQRVVGFNGDTTDECKGWQCSLRTLNLWAALPNRKGSLGWFVRGVLEKLTGGSRPNLVPLLASVLTSLVVVKPVYDKMYDVKDDLTNYESDDTDIFATTACLAAAAVLRNANAFEADGGGVCRELLSQAWVSCKRGLPHPAIWDDIFHHVLEGMRGEWILPKAVHRMNVLALPEVMVWYNAHHIDTPLPVFVQCSTDLDTGVHTWDTIACK